MLALLCSVMRVRSSKLANLFSSHFVHSFHISMCAYNVCIYFLNDRSFRLIRSLFIVWCRLKPFEAASETLIWTLNRLDPIEVHYMEKNPSMFSSKTLFFSCWMTWGWVNYQQRFFLKWTTPLNRLKKHWDGKCDHWEYLQTISLPLTYMNSSWRCEICCDANARLTGESIGRWDFFYLFFFVIW